MTHLPALAVTGATGAIGGLVARELADAGVPLRLLVRDAARAPELPGGAVVTTSYDDPGARDALRGVRTLFMVSGSESVDRVRQHLAFVDAAVAAGVEHVVYTSFYGAAPDATFTLARDHYATEQHLRASGMGFTFLRDNLYLDFIPAMVGDDGVIRGPAGQGRVAAVARADIAAVAVTVLGDPAAHEGATYDLTGPEALTLAEAAAVITAACGTDVTFHDETLAEAYASRKRWLAPDWQYDAWVSTYTAIAAGELAGATDHVARLTGRPPISLAEYLAGQDRPTT